MNIWIVAILCVLCAIVGLHYGYKLGFEDGKDDYKNVQVFMFAAGIETLESVDDAAKHEKEINPGSTL